MNLQCKTHSYIIGFRWHELVSEWVLLPFGYDFIFGGSRK